MAGSWKKTWSVRSYPDAVKRILMALPRVYEDGSREGILGWVGSTYSRQRRNVKPKIPRLTVEKDTRLVFQHDLLSPFTYSIDIEEDEDGLTRVQIEVRASRAVKETLPADQVVTLCYALSKALEPFDD